MDQTHSKSFKHNVPEFLNGCYLNRYIITNYKGARTLERWTSTPYSNWQSLQLVEPLNVGLSTLWCLLYPIEHTPKRHIENHDNQHFFQNQQRSDDLKIRNVIASHSGLIIINHSHWLTMINQLTNQPTNQPKMSIDCTRLFFRTLPERSGHIVQSTGPATMSKRGRFSLKFTIFLGVHKLRTQMEPVNIM